MSSPQIQNTENQRYKDFLQLIVENRGRIFGYILTLFNRASAEDLLQSHSGNVGEVRQFERAPISGLELQNFYYKVMKSNVSQQFTCSFQRRSIQFPGQHYEQPTCKSDKYEGNDKVGALETCLKRLSKRDSQIIQFRYLEKMPITTMAKNFGWSSSMMYKLMAKIHYVLKECIEKKIDLLRAGQ
jgi:DNA-directed RNA polymerase specialized sigma24 family protein